MLNVDQNPYHYTPGTLQVPRFMAGRAEPRMIAEKDIQEWNTLYSAMNSSAFAGVPLVIIDPDKAPKDAQGLETYVMDSVSQADAVVQTELTAGYRHFEDHLLSTLKSEILYGFVPPYAASYTGHDGADAPARAALVVAPGKACNPERDLLYGMEIKRPGSDLLLPAGNTSWRYYQLFHELAHVAGAREPQADHIAGLFCRRAFPDSPTPWLQADIRALEAVTMAVELATGATDHADHQRSGLVDYGWPMVVANDEVNAMTAAEIAAMSADEILARHKTPYRQNADRMFELGAVIRRAGLDGLILSGCTGEVMRGARKLERRIATLSDDSELRHIASRFALAARRIHGGAGSYVNPAKPHLFTANPR